MSSRCALIRPNCQGVQWEMQEPLGAEAVCGYLRKHGLEARVFDRQIGATAAQISAYEPDFVGFSLMTAADVVDALRLLQRLKTPGRRFFAGGLYVTCQYDVCRSLFPEDTVLIIEEGEGPVLSLVTGRDHPFPGPDEWAFASRDELDRYLDRGGVINIRTARGCRGNCAFCTTPGKKLRRLETRDISLVAEEMAYLAGEGYPPIFNFTDDEFGDAKRIFDLIEAVKKTGVRAAFSMELRPSVLCSISSEEWTQMHQGGLCRVFTGLENLNPVTLKKWHKPTDPEKLMEAIKRCRASGILCEAGYILFHEETTPKEAHAQVHTLRENGLFTPKAALSRLALFPGSELYQEKGIKTGMRLCDLKRDTEELWNDWSIRLGDYYRLWSRYSRMLPKAACMSFLYNGDSKLRELLMILEKIDSISYEILEGKIPSGADKEVLDALGRSIIVP